MECQDCQKPLGAESIDLGYDLCHDCRHCASCGLTVGPKDIIFCRSLSLPYIKHPRCIIYSKDDILSNPQNLVQVLNWCSSMPNTEIMVKDMTFDDSFLFYRSVQAIASNLSVLLYKNKREFEEKLREEEKEETIARKKQKKVPPTVAAARVGIKTTSDKVARHKLSLRDKGIENFMALGLDRDTATRMYEDAQAKAQERQNRIQ